MNVSDIMSTDVQVVSPRDNLAHVRNIFIKKKISRVLIYDKEPLGVLTGRDLTKIFSREMREIGDISVREVMAPRIYAILPDEKPEHAARLMVQKNISGLPVISRKEILGIITKTDLARYFSEAYIGKAKVKDLLEKNVPTAREFQSIFHAAKLLKDADHIVVLRDKKIAGIISERDVSLASYGLHPSKVVYFRQGEKGVMHRHEKTFPLVVADIMNDRVETIEPEMDAAVAVARMLKNEISSLVVKTNDGGLVGILTKIEVLKYLAGQAG